MNYGPGNIPNTMGSDSSTSGQVPLLLPFLFSLLLSGKHFNGPWHSGLNKEQASSLTKNHGSPVVFYPQNNADDPKIIYFFFPISKKTYNFASAFGSPPCG